MLHATTPKRSKKQRRREIRFPGIVGAAKALKVDRTHLYRVLAGERPSRRLSAAYRAFIAEARASGAG